MHLLSNVQTTPHFTLGWHKYISRYRYHVKTYIHQFLSIRKSLQLNFSIQLYFFWILHFFLNLVKIWNWKCVTAISFCEVLIKFYLKLLSWVIFMNLLLFLWFHNIPSYRSLSKFLFNYSSGHRGIVSKPLNTWSQKLHILVHKGQMDP